MNLDPRLKWNQYQPEERKMAVAILILGVICLVLGVLVGYKLLRPADTAAPAGMISERELNEQSTKASIRKDFLSSYRNEAPKPGTFWLGRPGPKEAVFTSKQAPADATLVMYMSKDSHRQILAGSRSDHNAVVITAKMNADQLKQHERSLSSPTQSTPYGKAHLVGPQARIYNYKQSRLIIVEVMSEPQDKATTKKLKTALAKLQEK